MCLSFTLEGTQWPILSQLMGLQGAEEWRLPPWWHQLFQGCLPRVVGFMLGASYPWSTWRLCKRFVGTDCFMGISFQLFSFHMHTFIMSLWLVGSHCYFFHTSLFSIFLLSTWQKIDLPLSPILILAEGITRKVWTRRFKILLFRTSLLNTLYHPSKMLLSPYITWTNFKKESFIKKHFK